MAEWYYGRKGQHSGPVTQEQLQTLLRSGRLKRTDLVWHDGLPEWAAVDQVPELKTAAAEASAKVWFYGQGGQQQGPASLLELRQYLATGRIAPDWLVWKDGMAEWTAAANVPELSAVARTNSAATRPQTKKTRPTSRPTVPVADSDLVAGFRQESKPIAAGEEIRGLFKRAKTKVRAKKLQFEIAGMEKTLRTEYIAAGQQTLESGGSDVNLKEERAALQQLLSEIRERQDRLDAVASSSGTGSIRRELQTEIDSLNEQSQEVFHTIGQKAFAAGTLSPEPTGKISNLESVVGERRAALESLSPHETASAGSASSRWLIGSGVALAVCAVIGLVVWGGLALYGTAFGDRLAAFRYVVPTDSDTLLFLDAQILETEAYKSLAERVDSERLDPGKDATLALTTIGAYSAKDKKVPIVGATLASNEVRLPKDEMKKLKKREHAGENYWVSEEDASNTLTFYRNPDGHFGFVMETLSSSGLTVDDLSEKTKELIDQIQKQHETKAFGELSKWVSLVPGPQLINVQTEPREYDTQTGEDLVRQLVDHIMYRQEVKVDLSEVSTALGYLKPENTPAQIDDKVKALIATLTLDEEIHAEERAYFSSETNAKDFLELLETKISDSRTTVKDKDFQGSEHLKLNVRKVLNSVEIRREEACVILQYDVPLRLISKLLDDTQDKE